MPVVKLRPVEDVDLDALFEQQRDPESVAMAAFTPADPGDRAAFDARLRRHRADPTITMRAITEDDRLVGSIASFVVDGDTELTYWLDRAVWGRGVAGRALAAFLAELPVRPLHARVASDNLASLRVLLRAGFEITGTDSGYAAARDTTIEETLLVLRAPAGPV